jgi:hypothetical protein
VRDRGNRVYAPGLREHDHAKICDAIHGQTRQFVADGVYVIRLRKRRAGVKHEAQICICALLRVDIGRRANPV